MRALVIYVFFVIILIFFLRTLSYLSGCIFSLFSVVLAFVLDCNRCIYFTRKHLIVDYTQNGFKVPTRLFQFPCRGQPAEYWSFQLEKRVNK